MTIEPTAVTVVTARGVPAVVKKVGLVSAITVLLIGAAALGATVGPRLFGDHTGRPPEAEAAAADKDETNEPAAHIPSVQPLERIGVDVRAANGELHVIKIGIAVELNGDINYEEFKKFIPLGRDAAIGYLRSLTYEQAVSPWEFKSIQGELNLRVSKALGRKLVRRVWFTDFVVE